MKTETVFSQYMFCSLSILPSLFQTMIKSNHLWITLVSFARINLASANSFSCEKVSDTVRVMEQSKKKRI